MRLHVVFSFIILIVLFCNKATGQVYVYADSTKSDSTKFIKIIAADKFRRVKQDSAGDLNLLIGHVQLKQENTLFSCDSAVQNILTNTIEAFGNIHINDGDTVHTYSQYLKYLGNTKIADLTGKVKLTDGKATLTSEALQYDVNAKIGTYVNNGKLVNKQTVLTSKEGFYYADTKEVYFQKNVKVVDPEFTMLTDTLLYNINSEIASFISPTLIYDEKSNIKTRSGFYDMKKEVGSFSKRPIIKDSTQLIIADKIDFDKKTGEGIAIGNILFQDSSNGVSVLSGQAKFNKDKKTVKAYQFPLMIIHEDNDTLYVSSDTLYSGVIAKDTTKNNKNDSLRFFSAYAHVKIFGDSLQGRSDSLYYSAEDSVFRFYKEPAIWANESQITGDTIFLTTKNRKADTVLILENAFSVNKTKEGLFNQLRGNNMIGSFVDGEIDFLRAKGNSESLYYLQDDKDSAYIGLNYAMADAIGMKFKSKELKRISWVNAVKGITYPMDKIPADKKTLKNFKWLEAERPKNLTTLISLTKN
ncbi:MAG: OstA-like protein [Chitinophagaceae bacterium]